MEEDDLNYGPLYEAPPVTEENYDDVTPDEEELCSKCIFKYSILCEICIHL